MANYLLGKIHLANRDRVLAIKHLKMTVDSRPDLSEAKRDLARALVLAGRHEEGIELYRKLLRADPADASLHALLAFALRTAGRMEEARMHAEKARSMSATAQHAGRQ